MAFRTPIDIANRALQHLGQFKIATFADISNEATQVNTCYDDLRLAELSRHTWLFSIRRARVRPLDFSTQIWTPPTYASGTTYTVGQASNFAGGSYANSVIYPWILTAPSSVGNAPDTSALWSHFFGSMYCDVFDSGVSYAAGELALIPPVYAGGTTYVLNAIVIDGSGDMWVSLQGANTGNTPSSSPTFWAPWLTPSANPTQSLPYSAIVYQSAPSVYLSLENNNGPVQPAVAAVLPSASSFWTSVGGTVAQVTILFPIGCGQASDPTTLDLYPLPFGWLRPSIYYAKRSAHPWLGALYGPMDSPDEYTYYGQFFNTSGRQWSQTSPFLDLTFIADIADVTLMPPQFCESLAVRIALEIDEPITQGKNAQKLDMAYKRITGEAMRVDAIVQGTPTQPMEEFIAVRF